MGRLAIHARDAVSDSFAPAQFFPLWSQTDLIRRVLNALDVANKTVRIVAEFESICPQDETQETAIRAHLREKVIAETAMLLLCAEPIGRLDGRILEQGQTVAKLIIPLARNSDVLGAICSDPGRAWDYSIAHAILGRLGYVDQQVDSLLSESLLMGSDFGPERLPHRRLEQDWLRRTWTHSDPPDSSDEHLLADSILGRPMDVLGSSRFDIYAFTHAIMYASDLGRRKLTLPRPVQAVIADAEAALAYSLDSNDFDLTAEILMTWPMLGLAWSTIATFAFHALATMQDKLGFLPGSSFNRAHYVTLAGDEQTRFALITSYHTTYVMGFLCAACLRPGTAPPSGLPNTNNTQGAAAAILSLIDTDALGSFFRDSFLALESHQQDSMAPLLLAVVLRRARTRGDLMLVRKALHVALSYGLLEGPVPKHAVALLRRSQILSRMTNSSRSDLSFDAQQTELCAVRTSVEC